MNFRFETVPAEDGTAKSTVRAKVWPVDQDEPTQWQVTFEDSTTALQRPGSFNVSLYVSGSATNAPGKVLVNQFTARTMDVE